MYPKCRKYQHFRVIDKNLGKSLIITLWWILDNFIWYAWKRRKYNSRRLWELGGFAGYVIYERVIIVNLKNMTVKEIHDYIMVHIKSIEDDEWLEISNWIDEFLKSNPSSEERTWLYWKGYNYMWWIVRGRNSICIKCRQQSGYDKLSCPVY